MTRIRLPLDELQRGFARYLLIGDNLDEAADWVHAARGIASDVRLDVYRNAYYTRLQESLAHDFPALLAIAGDRPFGALITSYLRDHPSSHPSLRWLGGDLPGWLRTHAYDDALVDVATVEWAVLNAFDAADVPSVNANALAGIPPERWADLRVQLHPSITLVASKTNAREVWSAVRGESLVPPYRRVDEQLVVWRIGTAPAVAAISVALSKLLAAFAEGAAFADVCERLSVTTTTADNDVAHVAASGLHQALSRGWIVSIRDGKRPISDGQPPRDKTP